MGNVGRREAIFFAVLLINFTSLLAEILLTRIFSVTLYYHFAFFVISVVMFGLSIGGTAFFIFKQYISNINQERVIFGCIFLMSISFLPILYVIPKINYALGFNQISFEIFKIFIICPLPFFFIGFLMSYLFLIFRKESGRLYFFDLFGASLGAFLSIFFINFFGPVQSLILLGAISSIALILVSGRRQVGIALLVLLVFIALLPLHSSFDVTMAKGYKLDSLFTKWNSFSMVRVYGNETSSIPVPYSWGMSHAFNGSFPPQLGMDIDADAFTPIIRFDADFKKVEFLKYDIPSFAYYLSDNSTAFIIGPGGGRDILTALAFGVRNVTAVEVNPIIVNDVMKGKFKYYSGDLYSRNDVDVVVDDARSYIRNSKDKYDIIQSSLVDTWAASSAGTYSLTENYLYTTEAVSEYMSHLSDNGYLTISRWGGQESLKLMILYLKAAKKLGIDDPGKHIVAIRRDNGGVTNIIFKKSEITADESLKIINLANSLGFELLYLTNISIQDKTYSSLINSRNLDEFIAAQTYDLRPSTDDRPFFFYNKRLTSIPNLLFNLENPLHDLGLIFLWASLFIAIIMTTSLIIVPSFLSMQRSSMGATIWERLPHLTYFSLLGLSFMIVEILFLQKFILFLGHPVYAVTVILFSILLFAGIGSFLTDGIVRSKLRNNLKIILAVVVGILILYNVLLDSIFGMLLGLDINIKIVVSIFLLGGLGLFLGMPFPIGIKVIGSRNEELIPFCWSLNGAFSVLGSIIAIILSMNVGFTVTIFIAAGLYTIAYLVASSKNF